METKKCTKCGEVKELVEYYKKMSECKKCHNKRGLQWANKNKEKRKIIKKRHYENNTNKIRSNNKKWKDSNRDKVNKHNKAWCENHPYIIKQSRKKSRNKNIEKIKNYMDAYRKQMPDAEIRHRLVRDEIPITPETIELKRKQLTLIRTIKQLQNETD